MTLRLVLVGIVAALGVSIPSQPSSDHWFDSAESWASALLAEWDTWEPADDGGLLAAGKRDHLGCEECRLARLRVAASAMRAAAGDPPAPKGEDMTQERAITAVLGESKAVFVDPTAIVGGGQPAVSAVELPQEPKAKTSVAFEPIRVSEPFESGIAYELNRNAEGLSDPVFAAPESVATTMDSDLALPEDAFELDFRDDAYPVERKPLELAKPSAIERSGSEPISCLDEEWAQAGCLNEAQTAWDEILVFADLPRDVFAPAGASPSAAAAPLGSMATHRHEPPSPALLVDLPRDIFAPAPALVAQEALHPADALVGRGSQPARLGDAVELTRRAVSAWVSVLIGPALVDVSRR
jgi:hypothetical protein